MRCVVNAAHGILMDVFSEIEPASREGGFNTLKKICISRCTAL